MRDDFTRRKNQGANALFINPGAVGDCILMLPLIEVVKHIHGINRVDLLANPDYTGFYPKRTCVDAVRSINSVPLHRLFVGPDEFDIDQHDPLIHAFGNYDYVISFLGEPGGSFESNLIFTVYCSHSAEITTIKLQVELDQKEHASEYYVRQYAQANDLMYEDLQVDLSQRFLTTTAEDRQAGIFLLQSMGIKPGTNIVAIHPGSGGKYKCWKLENYLAIADQLRGKGMAAIFILGPAEKEHLEAEQIAAIKKAGHVAENFGLHEILQILSTCTAFVGNDSGIAHVSAACGLPTVSVFGPTDPAIFRPLGPHSNTVRIEPADFDQTDSRAQQQVLSTLDSLMT